MSKRSLVDVHWVVWHRNNKAKEINLSKKSPFLWLEIKNIGLLKAIQVTCFEFWRNL